MIEWRGVPGWPTYEVSACGQIRRIARSGIGHRPGIVSGHVLKSTGYRTVRLQHGDRLWRVGVHRLVAITFIGPPPTPQHVVAHYDGCRTNNVVGNLRWATCAENSADMVRHGTKIEGERHGMAKVTAGAVVSIRRLYRQGAKQRDLARSYGLHQAQIHRIVAGKCWKNIGREPNARRAP